LTNHWIWI